MARVVAAVPVPEGGDRLRFGVALQGKGAVWLDDLELEVLTDLEVDMDQPFAVQAPLASPVNLDLEGA